MSASASAKSRMERILRLQEQIDEIKSDIREVYAEEKADGGDKTAMGAAVSYIRKREKNKTALEDREALVDVYLIAFDRPSHTYAYARTREGGSYAEEKGAQPDSMDGFVSIPFNAETGAVTEHKQPETAHEIHERPSINAEASPEAGPQAEAFQSQGTGAGTLAGHEGRHEGEAASAGLPTHSPSAAVSRVDGDPEKDAGRKTEPSAEPEAVAPTLQSVSGVNSNLSHSFPSPSATDSPAHPPPHAPGTLSDNDDVPAFLKQERPHKTIADYRPHPETCGATGLTHCYSCSKLIAARESEVA